MSKLQPKDQFYELRNGVFNMVVALFMEQEKVFGRQAAKKDVSEYLAALSEEILQVGEQKEEQDA